MGWIEGRNYPWALAINFLCDSIVEETFLGCLALWWLDRYLIFNFVFTVNESGTQSFLLKLKESLNYTKVGLSFWLPKLSKWILILTSYSTILPFKEVFKPSFLVLTKIFGKI